MKPISKIIKLEAEIAIAKQQMNDGIQHRKTKKLEQMYDKYVRGKAIKEEWYEVLEGKI